jgi:hypothetical protein
LTRTGLGSKLQFDIFSTSARKLRHGVYATLASGTFFLQEMATAGATAQKLAVFGQTDSVFGAAMGL